MDPHRGLSICHSQTPSGSSYQHPKFLVEAGHHVCGFRDARIYVEFSRGTSDRLPRCAINSLSYKKRPGFSQAASLLNHALQYANKQCAEAADQADDCQNTHDMISAPFPVLSKCANLVHFHTPPWCGHIDRTPECRLRFCRVTTDMDRCMPCESRETKRFAFVAVRKWSSIYTLRGLKSLKNLSLHTVFFIYNSCQQRKHLMLVHEEDDMTRTLGIQAAYASIKTIVCKVYRWIAASTFRSIMKL
jgi:hypothetical protein